MKKSKKSLILILAAAAILSMLLTIPVLAASTRKCYLIKNQNTTVYSNTALTKRYGTVYGSDEIKVLSVTSKYTRITYPISKGRTKTGYIKTSAILKGTLRSFLYCKSEKKSQHTKDLADPHTVLYTRAIKL